MENFSPEEEESLRKFLFTNPGGDISFIYPQPLIAGEELSPLMSAYSKTHMPFQDRVLLFLDRDKTEQARAILPMIPSLMDIFRNPDGSLKMSTKTAMFNKQWPLKHGHSSIKEETPLFGHCENISDITGKKITGHPLNRPQVKSTRYISFGNTLELSLADPDVLSLEGAEDFVDYMSYMSQRYVEVTEALADRVFDHRYTGLVTSFLSRPENVETEVKTRLEERMEFTEGFIPTPTDFEKERLRVLKGLEERSIRRDIGKFVLDSSRVYLLASTKTSMGYSIDARVLEEVITGLISSPRLEDQDVGKRIWGEAKKISPILLGDQSHVRVDNWVVSNDREFREYAQDRFGHVVPRNHSEGVVNLLSPRDIEMYTDRFNAALSLFPHLDASIVDLMEEISERDVRDVLERVHKDRGGFDVLHPSISHGGLMVELVMAYHGYRDIFRHRRGPRSNQLLTTRLGFETPEIFEVFGFDEQYRSDMGEAATFYESAREQSPHVAEKLVPFGANCRSLYSWQPNQIGYVGKIRGDISKGNFSYVGMARELVAKARDLMPITGEFLRVDESEYPAELWKRGYGWFDSEGGEE